MYIMFVLLFFEKDIPKVITQKIPDHICQYSGRALGVEDMSFSAFFCLFLSVYNFQALVKSPDCEVGQLLFVSDHISNMFTAKKIFMVIPSKLREGAWVHGGGKKGLFPPPLQNLIPISLGFRSKR